MTVAQQVGRNVAKARQGAGLSQNQFKGLVSMSQQDISGLENGRHCPRLTTLLRVARALDVPLSDLVQGIE